MVWFRFIAVAALFAASFGTLGSSALAQSGLGQGFAAGSQVAVIVKVPKPWYAPEFLVRSRMRDTIPEYQSLRGLRFKAFSFARADGHYGGVYLWKDVDSARAWFSPDWFARVKRERGAPADVRFFEVLLALDNVPGGTPDNYDSQAVAALVEIPLPAGAGRQEIAEGFASSAASYQKISGLLRKYFIITAQGKFGGIYIWKDEASAKAWFNDAWRDRVERTYKQPATIEYFETPILMVGKGESGVGLKGGD